MWLAKQVNSRNNMVGCHSKRLLCLSPAASSCRHQRTEARKITYTGNGDNINTIGMIQKLRRRIRFGSILLQDKLTLRDWSLPNITGSHIFNESSWGQYGHERQYSTAGAINPTDQKSDFSTFSTSCRTLHPSPWPNKSVTARTITTSQADDHINTIAPTAKLRRQIHIRDVMFHDNMTLRRILLSWPLVHLATTYIKTITGMSGNTLLLVQ